MSKQLTALVLLAAVISTAACSESSTAPTSPFAGAAAATGSGSTGSAGTATGARTIVEIMLSAEAGSAFQRASGKAKWDSRGSKRELEIEVEDVAPGTRLNITVAGVPFGATQTVDSFGYARVELSTELGQQVPESVAGARVEVRTEGGALVVAGSFK